MLVAEPGARQDHCGQARIGEVDAMPVGTMTVAPAARSAALVDAGPQVEPGAAGGRVGRQVFAGCARRESSARPGAWPGRRSRPPSGHGREPPRDFGDQPRGQRLLAAAAEDGHRPDASTSTSSLSSRPKVCRADVADDQRDPLALRASAARAGPGSPTRRRSRRSRAPAARRATLARMSGFSTSSSVGAPPASSRLGRCFLRLAEPATRAAS